MNSGQPAAPDHQPPGARPGAQIVVDRRQAWGVGSAVAMAIGSVGTWVTIGPWSVNGTAGSDGWITLAIAVAIGLLVVVQRLPWLALPGALVAAGISVGDAVRLLSGVENTDEWFNVSLGWGLVLVIAASASLAVWGAIAAAATAPRPRVVAVVVTTLALAGGLALALTDRGSSTEDSRPSLLDASATSGDDPGAPDASGVTETAPADAAVAAPEPTTTAEATTGTATKTPKVQRAGTIEWEFLGLEQVRRVGSVSAGPGERLLLARARWTNHGREPVSTLCLGPATRLIGANEEQWDPNTQTMLDLPGDVCDDLGPGLSRTDSALFVVPENARLNSIAFWDPSATTPRDRVVQFAVSQPKRVAKPKRTAKPKRAAEPEQAAEPKRAAVPESADSSYQDCGGVEVKGTSCETGQAVASSLHSAQSWQLPDGATAAEDGTGRQWGCSSESAGVATCRPYVKGGPSHDEMRIRVRSGG